LPEQFSVGKSPRRVFSGRMSQNMNDATLLTRFARDGSADAFRELVARHTSLVYACALQRLRDVHAAQDVTQAVWIALALKAKDLRPATPLPGWLYKATRFACGKYQRGEQRRKEREMRAFEQQQTDTDAASARQWDQLAPHLQVALDALSSADREVVLMRFYGKSSHRQIGECLNLSEDAAEKRVRRALDKLRRIFGRRGVTLTGTALGGLLLAQAAPAAPVALVTTASMTALAGVGGTLVSSTPTLMLAKGAIHMMFIAKVKTAVLITATCVVVTIAGVVVAKQLAESNVTPAQPVSVTPSGTPTSAPVVAPLTPSAPAANPAKSKTLELAVTANRMETELLPNGKNARPVQLKFTFTNHSNQPIKLDTYMLLHRLIRLRIEGPSGGVVTALHETTLRPLAPGASEFPVVAPGETFVYHDQPQLPSGHRFSTLDPADKFRSLHYAFSKPGVYKIVVIYDAPSPVIYPGTEDALAKLGADSWTGRLESEPLTIRVQPAAPAVAAPAVNEYVAQQMAQLWVTSLLQGRVDQVLAVSDVPFGWGARELVGTEQELRAKIEAVAQAKGMRSRTAGAAVFLKDKNALAAADQFHTINTTGLVFFRVMTNTKPMTLAIKPGDQLKVVGFSD
jgi:RNA polymerase sigma factor (sigma-70 family)